MTKEIINFINTQLEIDITKKTKTNQYVFARTIYYKLATELTNLSLNEIALEVNKDHCAVIHNLKNFDEVIKRPKLKLVYDTFKEHPIKEDRLTYTQALKINEQLIEEIQIVKQKYKQLLKETKDKEAIQIDKTQELLQGLTQQQLDLIHTRLEAMVKMIKTVGI